MSARVLLALGLALCAGGEAAAGDKVLKVVAAAPEGSPWGDAVLRFVQRVGERTRERITLRAILGGIAGDEVDTARACAEGKIFGWAGSAGGFGRVIPEISALELPFLFETAAEVDAVRSGKPLEALARAFERVGLTLVPRLGEVGWRSFAGRKALRSPADFRGLRVRSQENAMHLEMWRALGAVPRAISVLETMSALQAGVVEAFDQSPVYMFATSWYQHARVYTLSRHMYQPAIFVLCKGALAGRSAADRRLLADAATTMGLETIASIPTLEKQVLSQLAKEGVQLVELGAAEREVLRRQTHSVFDAFRAGTSPLGRELLDALLAATGRK